ncbi:MAG: V-type ATP synthase subunit E [Spirochaetales bacterium]
MDAQLKELIETIKSEGVESAEARAQEIIDQAQSRAEDIVKAAQQEAETTRKQAQSDAEKARQSGEAALKQAARDLVLNVENRITTLFHRVIEREVAGQYKPETVAEAIAAVVKAWAEQGITDLEVALPEKQMNAVEETLRSALGAELRKGVSLVPSSRVSSGFRVTEQNGNAYYDFTAEGVAEALSEHVSPKLASIIREAANAQE